MTGSYETRAPTGRLARWISVFKRREKVKHDVVWRLLPRDGRRRVGEITLFRFDTYYYGVRNEDEITLLAFYGVGGTVSSQTGD